MKKTRILVSSLLAAVMLVGAGYAAWTDKLTINSTISTGELNVKFEDPTWLQDNEDTFGLNYADVHADPQVFLKNGNNKKLDLTFKNMYPGITGRFTTKIINTGTIAAVARNVKFDNNLDGVESNIVNGNKLTKMDDKERAKITINGIIKLYEKNGKTVKQELKVSTNLNDFQKTLSDLNTWRLEPSEYIYFDNLLITLPIGSVDKDEMENEYAKCTLEVDFFQHNAK